MKLNVPYFSQERNVTCGLAALRMMLGFFGNEVSEKELAKEVKMHSFGTFSTDLGRIALKKGFKIKCYTCHLGLLGPLKLPYGTKIDEVILKQIKVAPRDKMTFESWENYIQSGGELIWDIPKLNQLEHFISIKKTPCLVSVNTATLRRYWKNWDNGHLLVINGVDAGVVNVLDPDPENVGKNYELDKDLFLPAWVINGIRSSSYILVVQKK